jgi:hypothetical protein
MEGYQKIKQQRSIKPNRKELPTWRKRTKGANK